VTADATEPKRPLLEVRHLRTHFFLEQGVARAVDDVSFSIAPGEALGLVGESGCGKSVAALSIMRLVPPPGRITGGEILFRGNDLLTLSGDEMRHIRGNQVSIVFQEPMTALNPVFSVGSQIAEAVRLHQGKSKRQAMAEAIRMMREVAIADPEQRAREYPHQLSGGMRQRVLIAMALACRPSLLIADEPTTALDVTIQAEVLEILSRLRREMGLAVLLITHDLGVIAETADRVAVMYCGRIVEEAPTRALLDDPKHPYTKGLLRSVPRPSDAKGAGRREPLPAIDGMVPDLLDLPAGCAFTPRCPDAHARCREEEPLLGPVEAERAGRTARTAACFLYPGIDGVPGRRQGPGGAASATEGSGR
jgi:oligopeptide/dipeptide ABC transporter ATP-binding protein